MKKILLFFIVPAIVYAGTVNISIKNHDTESSYTVNSNNAQDLKSKLIFPIKFNSIDFEYKHDFKYFVMGLNSSFLLNNKTTKGKDYDWQNNNLTIYSESNNKISKYYNLGISLSKKISNSISVFTKFNYKILDINWNNTYQEDYIQNKNTLIAGNTLKFDQEFYVYNLGISYKKNIFKKISFELSPSVVYSYINTKDTHALRDFYTIQNIKSFGYEIDCNFKYYITMKSNLIVSFDYINIKNNNTNMDYYNKLNENFVSYPSSYTYKDSIIGLHYNFKF